MGTIIMKIKLIVALAASISLSACSSIANGKHQSVMFKTGAVEGADCTVTGGRDGGVNMSLTTPGLGSDVLLLALNFVIQVVVPVLLFLGGFVLDVVVHFY